MKPLQAAVAYSVLAILVGVLPPRALAGGGPFEPIDAQPLIDACWALSAEDRDSGVTARMRSGGARSIGCLEGVIRDQAEALFDEETLNSLNLEDQLTKIAKGYQTLYGAIYNRHTACGLPRMECGSFYHVFHLGKHSYLLEEIIRDMVKQRNEYRL